MDLNRVVLAGNLARDPDLRFLPSGTAKCTLTLAVSRPPDKNGERVTDFLTVIAWRKPAETLGQYARKGEPIILEGRLQARDFQTEDGQKRHVVEVLLTDFSFVGKDRENRDGEAARSNRGRPEGETENESEPPIRRPARASSSRRPNRSRSRSQRAPASPAPAAAVAVEDDEVPF